ncbi:hypothetical protein BDU57DRAFT_573332 [Ampelomyces quisqualis]|uniref:F-box domain-containing protein n=1 Tax=Ampelomyces quisqualis TaxID=50730 RepID=A0A6A5QJL5_AMPQU|nr:hypothetical protein BDU57DRAFT_573332 [Ampelomyces quisqualis]
MQRACTTIHDLPDEIYLQIFAQFTHLDRNRDLANTSLVSKKWQAIAQEWLLKVPRFNLTNIDRYLWELGHHQHLQPQIKTLEIWSYSDGRTSRDSNNRPRYKYTPTAKPASWDKRFISKCGELIEHYASNENLCLEWLTDMHSDCVPALFGILLCTLPNLTELKLGNAWLMDIPLFSMMLSPDAALARPHPKEWQHSYLRSVVCKLFPRLEVLRISEANMHTLDFLHNVCQARIGGHLPALRRIEMFWMESVGVEFAPYEDEELRDLSALKEVQEICTDAEVEVYLYFPPYKMSTWEIGGTPWQIKAEPIVFQAALERIAAKELGFFWRKDEIQYEALEVEFDKDGDLAMQN